MKYIIIILLYINLNAGALESYGFFSHTEKKAHRKLEGSHLDKEHEISNHRLKTKNKIKNILSSSHSDLKKKHQSSTKALHETKTKRKKIVHEHTKKKLNEFKKDMHREIRRKRRIRH